MTFSLISENLSFNSEECEEQKGFYNCEFDLEKLDEGIYDLYFKDKNKCFIFN